MVHRHVSHLSLSLSLSSSLSLSLCFRGVNGTLKTGREFYRFVQSNSDSPMLPFSHSTTGAVDSAESAGGDPVLGEVCQHLSEVGEDGSV